jgi:acyl-CoA thioesterase
VFATTLSREWEIWGPNGGYLAALALRAAGLSAEIGRPASFYCHFLRSPEFAPVELEVTALRRGRRSESLSVGMTQAGRPVLQALVRTAAQAPGYEHQEPRPPEVPPAGELRNIEQLLAPDRRPPFAFWANIERRPTDQTDPHRGRAAEQADHADDANQAVRTHQPAGAAEPSSTSEPSRAVAREWTRFRPTATFADPFLEAARALILLDTYGWPAAYRRYRDRSMVAPNLDTAAWFHRFNPRSEWLLIDQACPIGHAGLLGVGGRVWDSEGRLLATGGAQLCCLPAPGG